MRIVLKILLVLAVTNLSFASHDFLRKLEPAVVLPDEIYKGKSYSEWIEEWYKYHYSIPADFHPANVDGEEIPCATDQDGDVWFLEGVFTNEVPTGPTRPTKVIRSDCVVPDGKSLFIAVLNADCHTAYPRDDLFFLQFVNEDTCATKFFDGDFSADDLYFSLDGDKLDDIEEDYFFSKDKFFLDFPDGNIAGVDCSIPGQCESVKAVAAGWFVHVKPLTPGKHTIKFKGSIYFADTLIFGLDITYKLTVE